MSRKIFEVFIFFCLCIWSLAGVFGDEVKSVSVTEGDSVSLHTDYTDTQRKGSIEWKFGPKNITIAQINRKNNVSTIYNDSADGRFRDRLKLDQTGSLIITNITNTHSGLYKVYTSRYETPLDIFNLTVYAHLSVPVISRDSSQCSSSYCSLLCSVLNVSDVTLSWYKGNSLLSSISVSNNSISLSLPLEVEYQDNRTYQCLVNNPISNQTTHLNISELCHMCPDPICCCSFNEAVIRLALSVLVGVASVAVLVYDIRSRSFQQNKKEHRSQSNSDLSDTREGGDALK